MPEVPKEVTYENYILKSTFFFNKLHSLGFFSLFEDIKKISTDNETGFGWKQRLQWGITEEAWVKVQEYGIDPVLVFAHPNIIKIHPRFIRYYRSVILMPQKGFERISGVSGINKLEEVSDEDELTLSEDKTVVLVKTINDVMSVLISLGSRMDEEHIKGMMFATAGATIDGSWRNAIGTEGERVIRTLLLKTLLKNNEVVSIIDRKGKSKTIAELRSVGIDPLFDIEKIRTITIKNGALITFSSEPDIELRDNSGNVLGGVEIKAGLDPAGALERLGAMFKSFEDMLSKHPDAFTILVASCITKEVEDRISTSNSVRQRWILTDIVNNKKEQGTKFVHTIRSVIGLIPRRM